MAWTNVANLKGPAGDPGTIAINAQTGTSYTLVAADSEVQVSNAAAIAVTIDPSVLSSGDRGLIRQTGAGQITVGVSSGTLIKGGPTAKTAQQGALLAWLLDGSTIYLDGECAAS
ncbi:hypothetical protein [Rhodanobacter lindaniclasticus]